MRRWLAWNLWFRAQEQLKGHSTLRILKEMEQADRMSAEELDQLRGERLQDLVSYSYQHVPYYRSRMKEAGVEPSQVRRASDVARLPILTKADVRAHRSELRSAVAGSLSPFTTGGSTGGDGGAPFAGSANRRMSACDR